ncbi:MAG: phosphomannomutase/phosphoglucomutase [Patescibacteria group bacterium]
MQKEINPGIFKAYDIRGVAGVDLDEEIMELIGKGFGTFVRKNGKKKIVLGRDIRKTSPVFAAAVARGLLSTGCDVFDAGVVVTPNIYYASNKYDFDAGVMITASHNPAEHNGVKMTWQKTSLSSQKIQEIKDIIVGGEFEVGEGKEEEFSLARIDYIDEISSRVVLKKPLKVVVDPSNATAITVVEDLLKKMNCEAIMINGEIDPDFKTHQPDPIVHENYPPLVAKILEVGADLGVMFDGDADRVGFVDEKGNIWLGDKIQMLLVRDILPKNPGSKVIVELKNSEAVVEEVNRLGGVPIFGQTGHTLIEEKLHAEGAILAAEMSCHYYIADQWYKFDDAMYAMARILQIITDSGRTFSDLMLELPDYPSTPEYRVAVPQDRLKNIVAEVTEYFKEKCDKYLDMDGIKGYMYDGWFLIRSSNTQPIISVRVEAKTVDGLEKLKKVIKEKLDQIEGVNLDWDRQYDVV